MRKELKKAQSDKTYEINEEWKVQIEAAIAYLQKAKELKEEKVEELTHALGNEIGRNQLFTLAVSSLLIPLLNMCDLCLEKMVLSLRHPILCQP